MHSSDAGELSTGFKARLTVRYDTGVNVLDRWIRLKLQDHEAGSNVNPTSYTTLQTCRSVKKKLKKRTNVRRLESFSDENVTTLKAAR